MDKNIRFPVRKKILKIWDTLFELVQIELQYSKKYFKISLPQEAGASGSTIKNTYTFNIYREYLLCRNPM